MSNLKSKPIKDREAIEDGHIKTIWQKFINPLIRYKPEQMSLMQFLEEIVFQIRDREISRHMVKKNFTMPGLFFYTATKKLQGVGYRQVGEGAILWVREDHVAQTVDVQWLQNGLEETCWQMSANEWEWIKLRYTDRRYNE